MIDDKHIIRSTEVVLNALEKINSLAPEPLVLFAVDNDGHMLGTVTDGDVRRALIKGVRLGDPISDVMNREFQFLRKGENDDVKHLREQRELKMQLVPILDSDNSIVEIINLVSYITKIPVDAVLMAGGKGERLRPLTENTPKPLLRVGDKAIIDHNIDRLISYGIKHISVTVNYLKEQIEEHFAEPRAGVKIDCVREPKFLGTIGSIKYVKEFFNDTIIVMHSDVFTNVDLEDFYLHFKEHGADMSVCAIPYSIKVPYGIFDLEGRVVKGVIEKPTYEYYANAGIYLIKRSSLDLIPKDQVFNSTDLLNALVKNGRKVVRFPLNGTWIDIGTPQEYQKANELVKYIKR